MEQEFTIVVQNVNEAPVSIVFKSTGGQLSFADNQARVNENSNIGVVVGTLKATDKDAGQTLVFRLDDNAGGLFSVSAAPLVSCTKVRERGRGGGGEGKRGRKREEAGIEKVVWSFLQKTMLESDFLASMFFIFFYFTCA